MKLSIIIPTTELKYSDGTSMGVYMLNHLLRSIETQTFTDYEIIISDHSPSSIIKDECDKWGHLNLKYYKNDTGIGSAAKNLNFGISKANGEYIKTIFQDDYFLTPNALELMMTNVGEAGWGAVGTMHCNEDDIANLNRPHEPRWQDSIRILSGVNTISGPSVIFFKNDGDYFDENLGWLNDVEFYYRLFKKFGLPLLISDKLVVQRLRNEGVSNKLDTEIKSEESIYVLAKHGLNDNSKDLSDYPAIYNRIKTI